MGRFSERPRNQNGLPTTAWAKSERDGRLIHMGDKSAKISGSRTKVTIGGKAGDRGDITVGMECSADLKAASGSEAKTIDCK